MKVIPPTQAVVRSLLASLQQLLLIHCVCVISPHVLHHCHPFISAALRSARVLSTLFTHHSFISVGPSVASSSLVKNIYSLWKWVHLDSWNTDHQESTLRLIRVTITFLLRPLIWNTLWQNFNLECCLVSPLLGLISLRLFCVQVIIGGAMVA